MEPLEAWFKSKGWVPWPFQKEAWEKALARKNGLISVPTGAGKTYAAYLGPLLDIHSQGEEGLQILYITPLRALARDIEKALRLPIEELGWELQVEARTGDTPASRKAKQKKKQPHILLTTPESLSILQSDPAHQHFFSKLKYVIIDEWHELCGTKRGVLLELSLAHLRSFLPELSTWVLSATLGNLQEAAQAILGNTPFELVQAELPRPVVIHPLLPKSIHAIPWAGFMGIQLLPELLKILDPNSPTLIFTNTRSQAERWFQAIANERPEWKSKMAMHHGSIDKKARHAAEDGIKNGTLSFIVATSSLDLGVDFPMVEKVVQIGSCKGVARLVQRAGRASHQPMQPCHVYMLPSHALEIAEILAVQDALNDKVIEQRIPLTHCADVLFQHLTTLAVGGGFEPEQTFHTIAQTHAYQGMSRALFQKFLNHLVKGGESLSAYPEYQKIILEDSLYTVKERGIALRHKMNIGTITSDASIQLTHLRGKAIGSVEEQFITKLKPGEAFTFGGKKYELVHLANLTATVRLSRQKEAVAPVWLGSTLPISPSLALYVRGELAEKKHGLPLFDEICHIQEKVSKIPQEGEFLIETCKRREGYHAFFYPFEGKVVHEALATLVAYRLSQLIGINLLISATDYGFELFSYKKIDWDALDLPALFKPDHLLEDLQSSHNVDELAKSRFREIAKIGGLIFPGFPGRKKRERQIQVSSGILFEVFKQYEPQHLLYQQAFQEVYRDYFQTDRLKAIMERIHNSAFLYQPLKQLTPLSVPLYASAMWGKLSPEDLAERIQKEMP